MKAYSEFNNLSSKLDELLEKQYMTYDFDASSYPIVLTIRPNTSQDAQMELYTQDRETCSVDAALKYRFRIDGINVKIVGRLLLSDAVMNKIKNLAKKMVAAYLFGHFAEQRNHEAMVASNKRGFEDEDADSTFEGFFDDEDEENEDGAEE